MSVKLLQKPGQVNIQVFNFLVAFDDFWQVVSEYLRIKEKPLTPYTLNPSCVVEPASCVGPEVKRLVFFFACRR